MGVLALLAAVILLFNFAAAVGTVAFLAGSGSCCAAGRRSGSR